MATKTNQTTTTDEPTPVAHSVNKREADLIIDLARNYLQRIHGAHKAEAALAVEREGKFDYLKRMAVLACDLGATPDKGYDRLISLGAWDAFVDRFNTELTLADVQDRTPKDGVAPEPRDLRSIDGSLLSLRSIFRKAIMAGYRIDGTESKKTLMDKAGWTPNRAPRPAAAPGDKPTSTVPAERMIPVLSMLRFELQTILAEWARVANLATPAEQAIMAECLVDALGTYKDRIAPATEAEAPATAAETVKPTAAQAASLKPRRRKRAA